MFLSILFISQVSFADQKAEIAVGLLRSLIPSNQNQIVYKGTLSKVSAPCALNLHYSDYTNAPGGYKISSGSLQAGQLFAKIDVHTLEDKNQTIINLEQSDVGFSFDRIYRENNSYSPTMKQSIYVVRKLLGGPSAVRVIMEHKELSGWKKDREVTCNF